MFVYVVTLTKTSIVMQRLLYVKVTFNSNSVTVCLILTVSANKKSADKDLHRHLQLVQRDQ